MLCPTLLQLNSMFRNLIKFETGHEKMFKSSTYMNKLSLMTFLELRCGTVVGMSRYNSNIHSSFLIKNPTKVDITQTYLNTDIPRYPSWGVASLENYNPPIPKPLFEIAQFELKTVKNHCKPYYIKTINKVGCCTYIGWNVILWKNKKEAQVSK